MRIGLAAAVTCLALSAAWNAAADGNAAPATMVEITLKGCSDAQGMVGDALQASDPGFVRRSLKTAQAACRSAAAELRKAPLPGPNAARLPAAIDQMVLGLGQVEQALKLTNNAPARARQKAEVGMRMYQDGLAALKAAAD